MTLENSGKARKTVLRDSIFLGAHLGYSSFELAILYVPVNSLSIVEEHELLKHAKTASTLEAGFNLILLL
jgi:hypothetical protein